MHVRRRRSLRRRVVLSTGTALVVMVAGVGGWFLHERNRTTEFGLADALSVLRTERRPPVPATVVAPAATHSADTSTSATAATVQQGMTRPAAPSAAPSTARPEVAVSQPALEVPVAGVYAYATSGYDAVSVGSRHTYPAETYAVLQRDGGCAWQVEHHVVDQHVDHIARCSQHGDMLRISDGSRITFFGQTDGLTYTCGPPVAMAADATCSASDGSQARYHGTVVDRPTVTVGDVTRPAIHLVLDVTMTGRARGTAHNQLWLDATTGLILRQIRDVDTLGKAAFGDVRYTEHAEFVLQSVTPQQ